MTYRPHCNRPHPSRGETIINLRHLDDLLAKERAHDDYLDAIRTVRWKANALSMDGYRQCLIDMADAIVRSASQRMG